MYQSKRLVLPLESMKPYVYHFQLTDIPLILCEKAWKNLLETTGERPDSKLGRNRRLQHTFRGWLQCFILAFFLFVIGCIAVKAFRDLIKERVEMGKRDYSHMGLPAN